MSDNKDMKQCLHNSTILALLEQAQQGAQRAYAPYSRFQVGAALLTASEKVFTGGNVENASYGLTLCAERAAIVSALSAGERDFLAIAITCLNTLHGAIMPCGACRQVMAEFFTPETMILVRHPETGGLESFTLQDLLPGAFQLSPDTNSISLDGSH